MLAVTSYECKHVRAVLQIVPTCQHSVRPGGARAAQYALAAAIGAVDARVTARGPAPPTMVCAVAAAGVDRRSASADDDAQTV